MQPTLCFQVDAFTDRPFAGNPAAVCIMPEQRDAKWMQAVAAEMNLSETAFVHGHGEDFSLRWFTPATEVELCGHATLASAHALWSEDLVSKNNPIRFQTKSGKLTCTRDRNFIQLDFPATPARKSEPPEGLLDTLKIQPSFIGESKFDKLIQVESEHEVRGIKPDFTRLGKILREASLRSVIVTSVSEDPKFDFVSRCFAPGVGIDEDPVTGSAHCCLGPYWSERVGKTELTAYQASDRGGTVQLRVNGDRVILGGNAITIMRGELSKSSANFSSVR